MVMSKNVGQITDFHLIYIGEGGNLAYHGHFSIKTCIMQITMLNIRKKEITKYGKTYR